MKILLIGKNGQLGSELQRTCNTLGELLPIDFPEIDLANGDNLRELIRVLKPGLIINAGAYTNVDKAEFEPELARAVNALAPAIIAEESKKINCGFIHYSTDYVFDGSKSSPYLEIDTPNPLNVYGKTKLEGENLINNAGGSNIILRTSWVYSQLKTGFVYKVLQWARKEEEIKVVDDQIGSPTWARFLAECTAQIIAQGKRDPIGYMNENSGLYHLGGSGSVSRYDWAQAILELDPNKAEQKTKRIVRASIADFPSPVKRPGFSALDCEKITRQFGFYIPNWKVSLSLALNSSLY